MMESDKDKRCVSVVTRWASAITEALGSLPAIVLAILMIITWFIGAFFVPGHLGNDTYQLLINTGTTIITFLMVFIIQNTNNRDDRATQAKLDAIIHVLSKIPDSSFIGLEDKTVKEIKEVQALVRESKITKKSKGS